nr:IS66 family insertion sequence element accessory protein TnpB [Escherichia coli]
YRFLREFSLQDFRGGSARDGKVFLTQAQLAMLLEGIDWRQPKRLLTSLTML